MDRVERLKAEDVAGPGVGGDVGTVPDREGFNDAGLEACHVNSELGPHGGVFGGCYVDGAGPVGVGLVSNADDYSLAWLVGAHANLRADAVAWHEVGH